MIRHVADPAHWHTITIARDEAERLSRLVGNLLDMTRIEVGALKPALEAADEQEIISAGLERVGDHCGNARSR